MKRLNTITHYYRRARSTKLGRALRTLYSWQPLTFRGLAVVLLATIAIRAFAIPEFDLIADIMGKALLALTAITMFFALIVRIRLGNRVRAEAFFDSADPISQRPVQSGLVLDGSGLPPYFSLRVKRVFSNRGVLHVPHLIKGSAPEDGKRHLVDEVIFPHRGFWELHAVEYRLEDALGLTSFLWRQPMNSGLEVSAPTLEVDPLPIVASSARSGDQLTQSRERAGDLFDIKAYDPSDGTKRILWKTFAKNGQLVVRRPEPAVIPEGEVAIYLVAKPQEDYVAGALQGYLNQLEENQITILFGTDGMNASSDPHGLGFIIDRENIQKTINRAAFSGDAGSGRNFNGYLGALQNSGRMIQQIIVFASEEGKWFDNISRIASVNNVKLVVAMVPEELDPMVQIAEYERAQRVRKLPRLVREARGPVRAIARLVVPELRGGGGGRDVGALARSVAASGAEVLVVSGRVGR
ncbi:MAG: DUF58 domain-containing protein [Bdellovibrionota bacterium]